MKALLLPVFCVVVVIINKRYCCVIYCFITNSNMLLDAVIINEFLNISSESNTCMSALADVL